MSGAPTGARGLAFALGLAFAGCSGTTAPRHATVKSPAGQAASSAAVAVRAPTAPRDRWTVLEPSRLIRTEVASARVGSSVYVLGGFDQATGRTTAAVERFDLVHRRWTSSRPLPVALNHASAFAYRGSLYVLDGYASAADTSTAATNAFWREDLATGRWHRLPSAPTARAALAVGVIGHRLYAAGGSDGRQALRTLEAFDFKTQRWLTGPPLGVAREHVGGAAVGGAFYVLAGRTSGVNLAAAERYVPGRGWQQLPSVPVKRSGFGAVVVGRRIVVFGGEGPGGTIAPVEAFDTRRSRWTSLPPMRTPRHGLGAVAFGRVVYALEGGPRPGLTYSRTAERLGVR